MSNIVIIGESGQGYGHIVRLHTLALAFSAKEHNVTLFVKDIDLIQKNFQQNSDATYALLPTPSMPAVRLKSSRKPGNYAEVLRSSSFYSVKTLSQILLQWKTLFSTLSADLIIFDASPIAMLSLRDLKVKKINIGDGFFIPPRVSPLPAFNMGRPIAESVLLNSEQNLVQLINEVLINVQMSPINHPYDIFQTHTDILLTIPELDLYEAYRKEPSYYGYLGNSSFAQANIQWKTNASKKLIGYLHPRPYDIAVLLESIAELDIESHIYIPGCDRQQYDRYLKHGLYITDTPIKLDDSIEQADIFLCNGGHSSVCTSVMAGVPVAIFPTQQEQFLTAQRCIDQSLGRGINPFADKQAIQSEINKLLNLEDRGKTQSVLKECKTKYISHSSDATLNSIIEHCEAQLI